MAERIRTVEMRPNTRGTFCPICEEWLEYVDWPSDLPRADGNARVFYAPGQVWRAAAAETEAMLHEHMAGHTAEVMLDPGS